MLGSWPRCLEQNAHSASPPGHTSQESPLYPVKFAFVFWSQDWHTPCRFLVFTSSASARHWFLGACNSAGVSFVCSKRDSGAEVWDFTDLTCHSHGPLQSSQLLACLEHWLLEHGLLWAWVLSSPLILVSLVRSGKALSWGRPPSVAAAAPEGGAAVHFSLFTFRLGIQCLSFQG